jgi:serine/threonine protein phosphatase 1
MPIRTIAIGDIHGHSAALAGLLRLIEPTATDTIVMMGDYVDGGPDSRGVLDLLIELAGRCQLVPLLGNHDEMMLAAREGRDNLNFWLKLGGATALESYGDGYDVAHIRSRHFDFLNRCLPFYEIETHFFVHARYDPWKPLALQDSKTRLWLDLNEEIPGPHMNGQIAVVGHTVQKTWRILDLPHLKCIDTGCGHGGLLAALHIESGSLWQVDEAGKSRRTTAERLRL